MDFGSLLYEAQKNEKNSESRSNYYKTKFSPPKKVSKDRSKLSVNVQKFLEKQNEEEKRKKEDDKKKLNELLTLRNQDKKSVNRVNKMLKLTKSANKSVLDDEGPGALMPSDSSSKSKGEATFQPDEDDYGYTSQAASSLYDKLMDKYSAMPDSTPGFLKPKKSSAKNTILDIKERVKASLRKEEEDKLLPHKRKRKHKTSDGDNDERDRRHWSDEEDERDKERRHDKHRESDNGRDKEREKAKRKPMPPPMDFNELLKLAEKKQHEPVLVEKKEERDKKKEHREREPERLMSKKERREYEAHVERRRRLMEQEREFERREKEKDRGGGGGGFKIPKKNKDGESRRSETEDSDRRRPVEKSSQGSSSSHSKSLSRDELVDKLKKPSSVWSAPCNLTPPKLKAKHPNQSESHRNSPSSRHSNDSPMRNGHSDKARSSNHHSSERSSSSRNLPYKDSEKFDKYRDNSQRDSRDKYREGSHSQKRESRDRDDRYRDREDSGRQGSRDEKSSADIERELLLEQFRIQQEAMKRLEEKLKSMVPSKSDDRRKRSPSPRKSSEKRPEKYSDRPSDRRLNEERPKLNGQSRDKPRLNGERERPVDKSNSLPKDRSKYDVRKVNGSTDERKTSSGERKNDPSTPDKNKRPTLNGRLKADLMKQPPKQFPPPDLKPKQFPPADCRPRQFPPPDVRRSKKPVKRRIESDSEYDSELDDFIVDDNDADVDISQEISNIFGYDRNKYSRYDDDDDDIAMESNFHRMEKEEYESTKAGIMEDLEDIAKEKRLKALAAKRKAMKSKR